jgi:membrane protein DedA with SNARE-associated domain
VGLFIAPFLHEDAALVAGGLMVSHHQLSLALAALSLFVGIISSDIALYGIGALARNYPPMRRFLPQPDLLERWLGIRLIPVVAICRVLPGVLGPVFIACGYFELCFRRFVVTNICTAFIYTGAMLTLIVRLGSHFDVSAASRFGATAIVLFLAVRLFAPWQPQARLAERLGAQRPAAGIATAEEYSTYLQPTHSGMPALSGAAVAPSERVPPLLFYLPIAVGWLARGLRHGSLTLPALANPLMEAGGLWGESKSACMSGVDPAFLAPFVVIDNTPGVVAHALTATAERGLQFPVVVKPDVGWQGLGVRLIGTAPELEAYCGDFPKAARIIIQEYVPYDGEAGILYARMPGRPRGDVLSVTLRYFPFVIGDGVSSLRELIAADTRCRFKRQNYDALSAQTLAEVPQRGAIVRLAVVGSLRVGGIYRNGDRHVTPALRDAVERIADGLPEFHYGRFDVRFRSIADLERGDFKVIEVNGAGAEAINIWDPAMPLREAYDELFRHQKLLFEIGALNRKRGFAPLPLTTVLQLARRQNALIRRYPSSA